MNIIGGILLPHPDRTRATWSTGSTGDTQGSICIHHLICCHQPSLLHCSFHLPRNPWPHFWFECRWGVQGTTTAIPCRDDTHPLPHHDNYCIGPQPLKVLESKQLAGTADHILPQTIGFLALVGVIHHMYEGIHTSLPWATIWINH